MKEEISWGSPITKLEAFRCQKPPRNRKRRMVCMPWHTGCASLEQAGTSEAQLEVTRDREPQHPRKNVCHVSWAWRSAACSCSPSCAAQPSPAQRVAHPMPCPPVPGGAPQRQSQATGWAGGCQGLPSQKSLQL